MTESFDIKKIRPEAVAKALEKAGHYRLLNEPEQAESICLDVLEAEPGHQAALVTLVLAITDQFGSGGSPSVIKAREYVGVLENEYERAYYSGIVFERQARSLLGKSMAGVLAYDGFRDAMTWYERAEELRPPR